MEVSADIVSFPVTESKTIREIIKMRKGSRYPRNKALYPRDFLREIMTCWPVSYSLSAEVGCTSTIFSATSAIPQYDFE